MAQISETQIKSIRPGETRPFVVESGRDVKRIQARTSFYKSVGSLPKGVVAYKTRYDKEQGVLMVTAMAEARDEQV